MRSRGRGRLGRRASNAYVYDPSNEPNRLLDLWADYGTTVTGSGVSSWIDRVGAYDFTQATDANRPPLLASWSNGKKALDFNGTTQTVRRVFTADQLLAANNSSTTYCFGELDTTTGTAPKNTIIDFGDGRCWLLLKSNNAGLNPGWFDSAYREVTSPATTGKHLWIFALQHGAPGTGTVYQDGTSLGTAAFTGLGLGGGLNVGSIDTGGAGYLDGKIGRLITFSGLHDAATMSRVRTWGQKYYGLP